MPCSESCQLFCFSIIAFKKSDVNPMFAQLYVIYSFSLTTLIFFVIEILNSH
jgi:hypothetical protein